MVREGLRADVISLADKLQACGRPRVRRRPVLSGRPSWQHVRAYELAPPHGAGEALTACVQRELDPRGCRDQRIGMQRARRPGPGCGRGRANPVQRDREAGVVLVQEDGLPCRGGLHRAVEDSEPGGFHHRGAHRLPRRGRPVPRPCEAATWSSLPRVRASARRRSR